MLPYPGPMGQRHRALADLRLKDLLVGFQRLARTEVGDLPPRSLSHSSKGSSKEANFCKAARIVALSVDDRHILWGRA